MKTHLLWLLAKESTDGKIMKAKCWLDCTRIAMFREWKIPKNLTKCSSLRDTQQIESEKKYIKSAQAWTGLALYVPRESSTSKSRCFLWGTPVFNNSVTEPSLEHKHATLHSSIRKTKKIWRLKREIICKRNLPRVVLLIRKRNCRASTEASDMSKRKRGSLRKMVCKMFSKHHWPPSIVYTWKNIDFFVAIGVIIRHLVRCGRLEALLSSELVSNTLLGSRGCTHFQKGYYLE